MKTKKIYIIGLCLMSFQIFAEEIKPITFNEIPVSNDEKCDFTPEKGRGIDDFIKTLNSGQAIDPKILVNNPYFLDPCFKEHAKKFASSYNALGNVAAAVSKYKGTEFNLVSQQSNIDEKLGKKRKKSVPTKAKKKVVKRAYAPKGSFGYFKKNVKLIGTMLVDNVYVAHVRYKGDDYSYLKEGDRVDGYIVDNIQSGSVIFLDKKGLKQPYRLAK